MNYPLLTIYADLLDDLEKSRIATESRIRSLRQVKGLAGSPEEERLDAIAMGLAEAERAATKELQKAVKAHPLGPWIKGQVGLGEKQVGRLLGALGDPLHRPDPETGELVQRSVSQLWSFCGYGDARTQVRRRGQRHNWNADLKMRAHLIAESLIKQVGKGSPYRAVYDQARAKYADAVHADECLRCGPSGRPAQAGSPLNDGHRHARALRAVAKAFLKDLWVEARRVQMHDDPHSLVDPARDLEESPA
ncbi:MAG TPA: hypothetical protein VI039_12680 [Solirubrobacterales bacterium]